MMSEVEFTVEDAANHGWILVEESADPATYIRRGPDNEVLQQITGEPEDALQAVYRMVLDAEGVGQ
jgi:hypothetical protein